MLHANQFRISLSKRCLSISQIILYQHQTKKPKTLWLLNGANESIFFFFKSANIIKAYPLQDAPEEHTEKQIQKRRKNTAPQTATNTKTEPVQH